MASPKPPETPEMAYTRFEMPGSYISPIRRQAQLQPHVQSTSSSPIRYRVIDWNERIKKFDRGLANAEEASLEELTEYVETAIFVHSEESLTDETLWLQFKDEFNDFSLRTWDRLPNRLRIALRLDLIQRGVFIRRPTSMTPPIPISHILHEAVQDEQYHTWTDQELKAVLEEVKPVISIKLSDRLNEAGTKLKTDSQESPIPPQIVSPQIASPQIVSPQIVSSLPHQSNPFQTTQYPSAKRATFVPSFKDPERDAFLRQQEEQNRRQHQAQQAEAAASYRTPESQEAYYRPFTALTDARNAPRQPQNPPPSDRQSFYTTPREPDPYHQPFYPAPREPDHRHQPFNTVRREPDHRHQPFNTIPREPDRRQPDYTKEAMNIRKAYQKDQKYGGSEDSFDFKLAIFYDICEQANLPPEAYKKAFSAMLKDQANDYYYNSGLSLKPFDEICSQIRAYFKGPEHQTQKLIE
ncbi:hypothetical protein N7495_001305 [Penicillium taxi]|uniref:uncharacterized protein n=1 Tax=Penicillium taxi TaxID=168475 RepID=UPI00254509B0|nr:uncharacterized protein N7495_001305 [Penicillium taxi]KAJ5908623.1 hypothetical protein N7495_001305 [Penicillium taxi]